MTTDKSRAGALTDEQSAILTACAYRLDEVESLYLAEELRSVLRALLAIPRFEQPEAAPIDVEARFVAEHGHRLAKLLHIDAFDIADRDAQIMAALRSDAAPAPADERAAFELYALAPCPFCGGKPMECGAAHPMGTWVQCEQCNARTQQYDRRDKTIAAWNQRLARPSSANETGTEGLAHEVWAAAQLASGEGIEDGTQRIAAILSRAPAQAAEPVAIYQVSFADEEGWCDAPKEVFDRHPAHARRIVYGAPPPPAPASAPVGLTEQAITDAVKKWFPDRAYQAPFFARELLEGAKQ